MATTKSIYSFPEFDFLRQGKLWVNRTLPSEPDLDLGHFGEEKIPISPLSFDQLLELSQRSRVGVGRETVYDEEIRASSELYIEKEDLNPRFLAWLASRVTQMALELEHPTEVTLEPYKLILYQPGDHFDEHIDALHEGGQVMTLSVSIPVSEHAQTGGSQLPHSGQKQVKGGNLVIEGESIPHPKANEISLTLFYIDANHKVEKVIEGNRIVLVFDVIMDQEKILPAVISRYEEKFIHGIAELRKRGVKQIGFLANHLYMTDEGDSVLDPRYLKGLDLVGYLLFIRISSDRCAAAGQCQSETFLEKVAEKMGKYFFETLLDVDPTGSFHTLYHNVTEDYDQDNGMKVEDVKKINPTIPQILSTIPQGSIIPSTGPPRHFTSFVRESKTSYDSIELALVKPEHRSIVPKYLMGRTVLLESSGLLRRNFSGDDDLYMGNEGFSGEVWTNVGIFCTLT